VFAISTVLAVSAVTRQDKLADTWAKVSADPYTANTLSSWDGRDLTNPLNLIKFGFSSMDVSFDTASDAMPHGRTKYIHSLGAVAQARLVAQEGTKYSGLFQGSDSCLARLSLAVHPGSDNFVPGMAFKCFRDGNAPSGNFITMYSLDGQKDNFNFFQNTFTNIIEPPTSFALKIIALIFKRASQCPTWISTKGFSSMDQNGVLPSENVWPIHVFLEPTSAVQFGTTAGKEFREDLMDIPSGSKLWDVYGQEYGRPETRTKIAEIITQSKFVASQYGDETLFFQHFRGELDNCPKQ